MADYGSADVTVQLDNPTDTLVDISAHVLTIGNIDKEALMEEVTAMGAAWFKHLSTGVFSMPELSLGGVYDDAANAPDDLAGGNDDLGDTRTLEVTFGSTKTITVETIIKNFRRIITKGEKTKYELVLQPTGVPVEA